MPLRRAGVRRRMRGPWRSRRRCRSREGRLDVAEQPGERVDFGARQVFEQGRETILEEKPDRREARPARFGQLKRLAPSVARQALPLEQAPRLETADELGDRGRGDGRAPGQVGPEHVAGADGLEHEVLRDGERRGMGGEQPLDPAAHERRRARERRRRIAARDAVPGARH